VDKMNRVKKPCGFCSQCRNGHTEDCNDPHIILEKVNKKQPCGSCDPCRLGHPETCIYPRIELEKKGFMKWWMWVLIGVVLLFIFCLLIIASLKATDRFFKSYDLEFPQVIQLNWPVRIIKKVTSNVKKTAVKGAAVQVKITPRVASVNSDVDSIVEFIWTEESGKGTAPSGWHVGCRNKGMWNEIGWSGPDFCFRDESEGLRILRTTISERLVKNGIVETLCVYNLGPQVNDKKERIPYQNCMYYQKFLKFI